ncbi:hypothetical protein G3I32_00085 [Streptomyces coelicoflavus]|uniref:Uncharacterized protein n=1 Tax=Streptomyces coelicoflavus TaxID=285562 RepID=A0A7K3PBF9_9ACTN|nr:hypothetical protein [Streptomyces coelicoflavus]
MNVSFILGGGTSRGETAEGPTQGSRLAIQGRLRGLAATADGTVYLFTQEDREMVMWKWQPSGVTERVPLSGLDNQAAEQAAVAPDGTVYLAAGDLWKIRPDGKATKIVDTRCGNEKRPFPLEAQLDVFCTDQVTGVAIGRDGSVYFGDQTVIGHHASYVHRVSGDTVELIAGRQPRAGESLKRSNPAVEAGIDPPAGTKATDVLAPDMWNSGWLSLGSSGIYWRTGPGIVRINTDGSLSPLVGAQSPTSIGDPKGPFESMGRAIDAEVGAGTADTPRGDVSAIPRRSEVYYSDARETYSPPFSEQYRWGGGKSASQEDFIQHLRKGEAVYRVLDDQIAPVVVGAQSLATSGDALYIAAESSSGGGTVGVLQVELPKMS